MAIKAITFDFWSTLFRDTDTIGARRKLRVDAFVEATGVSCELAEEAHQVTARAFLKHHIERQQTLGPMDCVRMMADHCGVTIDAGTAERLADVVAHAILAFPPVPIEGALEAVRAAAAVAPVALISDTGHSPGSALARIMEAEGFRSYFRTLVFSDEVGVSKPQAPMFYAAAQALGVLPSELLHIGDLEPTDIAGAHGVGAKAALFSGFNDRFAGNHTAHFHFASWGEFVDALPGIVHG
ncbi:MAG: hypothetical protein AMXMBFR84_20160 [Candidatus Hydrogenedentota bacterium]